MILGEYLLPHDLDVFALVDAVGKNIERARPEGKGHDSVTTRLTAPMHLLLITYGHADTLNRLNQGTVITTNHWHLAAISHPSCQLPYSCTSS